jgi:hypothetical protein
VLSYSSQGTPREHNGQASASAPALLGSTQLRVLSHFRMYLHISIPLIVVPDLVSLIPSQVSISICGFVSLYALRRVVKRDTLHFFSRPLSTFS